MNISIRQHAVQNRVRRINAWFILAAAVLFFYSSASAAVLPLELVSSSGFSVLAGAGITVTGPTTISGDIGTFPTLTISGVENITLGGVNHGGDAVTQQAKADSLAAYNDAFGRTPTIEYAPIFDLGGLTLSSGVYKDPSSFGLTGTLILDGGGDPNAVWIFQTGSTLITASDSSVSLINGAQAGNVFWQVGSSATLGSGSDCAGSILAWESITMNAGAAVYGRVFAQQGAVTLNNNAITTESVVPEPGSTLLLGSGLVILFVFRRRHTGGRIVACDLL